MPRRKRDAIAAPVAFPVTVLPGDGDANLEKQSRYGNEPWKPGQIPTRMGSRITAYGRFSDRPRYGQFLEVKRPFNAGKGKPDDKGNL